MLTGAAITAAVASGDLVIDPFDPDRVCANSYSFHLGKELLRYPTGQTLDAHTDTVVGTTPIPDSGYVLRTATLYLASTAETMGSNSFALTLHACRSVSSLGLRIQLSAPLGHCGAVIPWTLELRAAMPVRVYAGMTIGKIAVWPMRGRPSHYFGRYRGSTGAVRSLLAADCRPPHRRQVIASAGPESASPPDTSPRP